MPLTTRSFESWIRNSCPARGAWWLCDACADLRRRRSNTHRPMWSGGSWCRSRRSDAGTARGSTIWRLLPSRKPARWECRWAPEVPLCCSASPAWDGNDESGFACCRCSSTQRRFGTCNDGRASGDESRTSEGAVECLRSAWSNLRSTSALYAFAPPAPSCTGLWKIGWEANRRLTMAPPTTSPLLTRRWVEWCLVLRHSEGLLKENRRKLCENLSWE